MLSLTVSSVGGVQLSSSYRQVLRKAIQVAARQLKLTFPLNVVVVDPSTSRKLNSRYRGVKKATDVLSFFYEPKPLSGEIIICYDIARRQAKELGHSITTELAQLAIHACAHIAGYDHELDKDKKIMSKIEDKIWHKYEQTN